MNEVGTDNSPLLIERLEALRRIARRRLLAYGVCAVLSGGLLALLTIMLLDWLLWLPAPLRIFGGVAFVVGFGAAARHWIIVPYRGRLSHAALAGRLEKHFPHLQDRLSSTVSFLRRSDTGSTDMMQKVIENTDELVRELPFESILVLKPLVVRAALLAVGVGALTATVALAPNWMDTGVARYVSPLGGTEWPKDVSIVPLTGDMVAALGESVTVRMSISRGWKKNLRAVVRVLEPDGASTTRALRQRSDGEYFATLDRVTEPLRYWFEAGDDSTQRTPYEIRVVKRPTVVEALADIEPPTYASQFAIRSHDLRDGPAAAPLGGFVTVHVHTSKPIDTAATAAPVGLLFEDGSFAALDVDGGNARKLQSRFPVANDMHFRVQLMDHEGLANRNPAVYSVVGMMDTPPIVTILSPRSIVETTPSGTIAMEVRVEDDYGILEVLLESHGLGEEHVASTAITDAIALETGTDSVEGTATHLWDLAQLDLHPGDVLSYAVSARDNCTTDNKAGQQARSPLQRIKIISEAEFDTRARDELVALEGRLRRVLLDEIGIHDQTQSMADATAQPPVSTNHVQDAASVLAGDQGRLVRRAQDIAERLLQLHQRVDRNRSQALNSFDHIEAAGQATHLVAQGSMSDGLRALNEVADSVDVATGGSSLSAAATSEQSAIKKLESILSDLSQHGDFHSMVAKGRDLVDRQSAVRASTMETGDTLLGKAADTLTEDERATLNRVRRRQDQIVRDVERWLERMEQVEDEIREGDPAGSQAIADALRTSRAIEVRKNVRAASDAIAANRTAAASIDQRQAIEGMKKVIQALGGRKQRELLVLQKQLDQFEEQVARLREQQLELRDATQEAGLLGGDQPVLADLGERQRRLRRNAEALARELADEKRTAPAAGSMSRAASSMKDAQDKLRDLDAAAATASQDGAIALLDDCLAMLEQIAEQAADELFQHALGKIRDLLEELRDQQRDDVNEGLSSLLQRLSDKGRLDRQGARQAAGLAIKQAELQARLVETAPTLEHVPVYEWALGRVSTWMASCRQRLSNRDLDHELLATAERIVRELDKLIGALDEIEGLSMDSEFAEADGGGSGKGQSMKSKPVPTVAELMVLKYMQREITERTAEFHTTVDLDAATEAQLRHLTVLGEDQAEIRRLTKLVIGGAQQP